MGTAVANYHHHLGSGKISTGGVARTDQTAGSAAGPKKRKNKLEHLHIEVCLLPRLLVGFVLLVPYVCWTFFPRFSHAVACSSVVCQLCLFVSNSYFVSAVALVSVFGWLLQRFLCGRVAAFLVFTLALFFSALFGLSRGFDPVSDRKPGALPRTARNASFAPYPVCDMHWHGLTAVDLGLMTSLAYLEVRRDAWPAFKGRKGVLG